MYFQTAIPTPSQEQPCCLVIIRPPSGVCTSAYHPVPTGCLPAGLMQHIGDSFSSKIGRAQRMYCRGFLLQTSVIAVVDLAKIENNPIGTNYDVIVHENGPDKTLTKALHNPELLANVPFEVFMANQPGLFIQAGHRGAVPQKAIMIHFASDPTAQRVLGMTLSGLVSGIGTLIKTLVL